MNQLRQPIEPLVPGRRTYSLTSSRTDTLIGFPLFIGTMA